MRKNLALFVFLTTCTISFGQLLTEKKLIGKWSVTKVTSPVDKMNLPESLMKDVIALKKVFHNSIFEFKENGQFFIQFANETSLTPDYQKINGKNWKLNLEDEEIRIVDKEKGESRLMFFSIHNFYTPTAVFSIGGALSLHVKKGVFSSEIDYDKIVVSNKTYEKSREEKSKELYGEDLYKLGKVNEAKNAISYEDVKIINGIAYFKDPDSLRIIVMAKTEERYVNGKLKMEGWFLNGKKDKYWTWYYKNGQVSQEKKFIAGKLDWFWREWNENGKLTRKDKYKNGVKMDD